MKISAVSEAEVLMVMGYKINVDWTESAAIDLLLLDWLQYYKDMRKFWNNFRRAYRNLVDEGE